MSWKFVFNLTKTDDIGYATLLVRETGYKFFACGERVFFYEHGRSYYTGIDVCDLF